MGDPPQRSRRGTLRRTALAAGVGASVVPVAMKIVREDVVGISTEEVVEAEDVGLAVGILPLVALLIALLLRPDRYRPIYWLAPLWFAATAVQGVAMIPPLPRPPPLEVLWVVPEVVQSWLGVVMAVLLGVLWPRPDEGSSGRHQEEPPAST